MKMCGADVVLHHLEAYAHTVRNVSVADIEAKSDVGEVSHVQKLSEFLSRRKLIGDIFEQQSHSQRLGEGAQMLDCRHGRVKLCRRVALVGRAQMLDQE